MSASRLAGSLLIFILLAVPALAATRPASEQEAIDWLLSEVKGSDAVFIRNGSQYNGEKAAAHLQSKLVVAGKRVQTARQFIVGVASRSSASGKPYEIQSKNGVRQPLEKWLLERLAVFEKGKAAAR